MSSLVLPFHINAAFEAFNLDGTGLLYVSDAVLALDSLLIACWGTKGSLSENVSTASTKQTSNNNKSNTPAAAKQQQQQQVSSGSGSTSDSLTLPGVSRSKILQALKHSLLKANVDPDEVAISSKPVVTLEIFQSTATTLLSPLPNVAQADVDNFAAFQSLNQHQDKTRVDRRALRRSLFGEYDSDIYIKKDAEDELDERLTELKRQQQLYEKNGSSQQRSPSSSNNGRSASSQQQQQNNNNSISAAGRSAAASISNTTINPAEGTPANFLSLVSDKNKIASAKFDGVRNVVGCDDLMLNGFAKYPTQGFSFDEWKSIVTPVNNGRVKGKKIGGK
jgi:hypothetical protein